MLFSPLSLPALQTCVPGGVLHGERNLGQRSVSVVYSVKHFRTMSIVFYLLVGIGAEVPKAGGNWFSLIHLLICCHLVVPSPLAPV